MAFCNAGSGQPARPAAAAVASKLYTMYAPVYGAAIEPAAAPSPCRRTSNDNPLRPSFTPVAAKSRAGRANPQVGHENDPSCPYWR